MTILKLANVVFLQWFFIRLAKIVDTDTGRIIGWKVLTGIVPLTGWTNDYRYLRRKDV